MDKVKFIKDVEIAGNLTVQGEAVVSNLETVVTPQNTIKLRDGATTSLLSNEYTGIIAEKYDGTNTGMLVFNNAGTAYVGDQGDLQPLATRDEANKIANESILIWDATNQKIVDGSAKVYIATAPVMDGTASAGSASTLARSDHKHPTDTSRASQTDLNSHTGNKSNPHGVTAAQLGIDTNILNKEAYLQWGGRNIVGGVAPVDAALNEEMNANRLAFLPANDITVEYSTDGGSTWIDYELTDGQKQSLVTTDHAVYVGKKINSKATVNDKVRVTISATEGHTYFMLRKIQIFASTGGASGTTVHIERAMRGSETTFSTVATYDIGGWSGWNIIPYEVPFGGGATQTGNTGVLRFTFSLAGVNANYNSNLLISKIRMFGETSWTNSGGSIAANGHMYSYDINKNVTFPAAVTATNFIGTATKATQDANGNNIVDTYMQRKSYERIESSKNLNDYHNAGFYNVKTQGVLNCPEGIGIDAALLVYPWNSEGYELQEITETAASSKTRRWVRRCTGSNDAWTPWKAVITEENIEQYAPDTMPEVSASDNGKIMMVSDGRWTAVSLPVYRGELM